MLVSLMFTACSVGEVPIGNPDGGAGGGDGGGSGPGQSFEARVKPVVTRCLACHGAVQAPNLTSYSAIAPSYILKPGAASLLVTKGEHEGQPFLTPAEQAIVAAWIDTLP